MLEKKLERPFRVYVGLIQTSYFVPQAIEQTIRSGMIYCGLTTIFDKLTSSKAQPRFLAKVDMQLAHPKISPYGYTHPEITRAVVSQILSFLPAAHGTIHTNLNMLELKTKKIFSKANGKVDFFKSHGYFALEKKFPVKIIPNEESDKIYYLLSSGEVVLASKSFSECPESTIHISIPKLRSSLFSNGLSGAVRLSWEGSNFFDPQKASSALEVFNPQLIVGDGIITPVSGSEYTSRGSELGVILVSNNAVAHDWIFAQILNQDFSQIAHLKIVQERGWGPTHLQQIELGGAGADGIAELAEKTKSWQSVAPLGAHFQENLQLKEDFPPFEWITKPCDTEKLFLDWIYSSYDFTQRRAALLKWQKVSIYIGKAIKLPQHYLVYGIGDEASAAVRSLMSTSKKLFSIWGCELLYAQFKDEKYHVVVLISGSPPSYRVLHWIFFLTSLGKMSSPLLRFLSPWTKIKSRNVKNNYIITSELPHNWWWSLTGGKHANTHHSRVVPEAQQAQSH